MIIYKTVFHSIFDDILFRESLDWAHDNNIRILYTCPHGREATYEFSNKEDLLAFMLKYGELTL